MSDFLRAFTEGIEAAKAIHNNKNEITSRVNEFIEQLRFTTSGKLQLVFELNVKHKEYALFGNPVYRVFASNPLRDDDERVYMANWVEDKLNGYPCKLEDGESIWVCNSILEVDNAFTEFVRNPANALKFLAVMNQN